MFRSFTRLEGRDAPSFRSFAPRARCALALLATLLGGCDRVLGIQDYEVADPGAAAGGGKLQCAAHSDCAGKTDSGGMFPDDFCYAGRCTSLRSEDCDTVTGPAPANANDAVLIGSLFATSGAQRPTNLARQRSAVLAVEEVNSAGGVKLRAANDSHPLVLVSCDSARDLSRAARHLIDDLGVSAIVGPNTSQDTLDLATQLSIESGTLLVSPTAQASSIADLLDHDLSWLMVPSDLQRAPLLVARIEALAAQLASERTGRPLRLGVVLRDDVLAQGARAALSTLQWNGEPVSSQSGAAQNVRIDSYAPSGEGLETLVSEYTVFAPDLIVLVGTAETVSQFMGPLERDWLTSARAHYVVTDSSKVPDLLELARRNDDLRGRVTGIGMQPTAEAAPNQAEFARDYALRYSADQGSIFGTGQTYDAVYALSLAFSAATRTPVRGLDLARGMRLLYGGVATVPMRPANLMTGQQMVLAGQSIRAVGSFAALRWDERGALADGTVEVFCLGTEDGEPIFGSSGLSFDVASGQMSGVFTPCGKRSSTPTAEPRMAGDEPAASPEPAPSPGAETCAADCAADAGMPSESSAEKPASANPPPDAADPVPMARILPCDSFSVCGVNVEEYCCISGTAGTPSCETQPRSCTYEFRCARASDCGTGQQCCEIDGKASCLPADEACPGAQFECVSARDCPTGLQCCSHLTEDRTAYAATRCEEACDAAENSAPLCEVPLDCRAGSVCRVSNYLPNLHVCEAL
jgi:branched-chain amino acid transport system substrate-binding protein